MTLVRTHRPSHMNKFHDYRTFSDLVNEMFTEEKNCANQFVAIPPANIIESKFDFRVEIAAPGFEKGDFKIDLDKNLLTISLNKEIDANEDEKYNLKEYNFTSFKRTFRISDKINTEKINALYKNGILQVTLPKKEEALEKPAREIKIS